MINRAYRLARRQALIAILVGCLIVPAAAQRTSGVSLSQEAIKSVIGKYTANTSTAQVREFIQTMPAPVRDERFRSSIHASLPAEFIPHLVNDPALIQALCRVLEPVLSLYNRTNIYDILLIDHSVPLLVSDSGVLLCFTTGLLRRFESEDELLGYVAHEIGHEWLVKRTVETRTLYEAFLATGDDAQARQTKEKLAIIELETDAFAALTLAYLGRSPLEYAKSLQRVAEEYSHISIGNHPPESQRAEVITSVVPEKSLQVAPRKTAEFNALKNAVEKFISSHQ